MNFKTCSKCDLEKPLPCFYKQKEGLYGRRADCISCNKKRSKKYYYSDKEYQSKRKKDYYERNKEEISNKRKIKKILNNSIQRNHEEFRDKLNQSKFCSVCEEYKSFDEFYKGRDRYKLCYKCIDCLRRYRERIGFFEYQKEWKKNNPNQWLKWANKNREKYRKQVNHYRKERRKNNKHIRILENLRSRINKALKNNHKSKRTEELLGCTIEEFKDY
ncbi:MAG TPA: hypothetical protein VLA13_06345, partial [Massilibacterium sp.]|nr:hypothetical protein [Massilibacterium sp.]